MPVDLRRWGGADGRCVAVLVAVPLLVFVIPAAAGHPAITGDNLIQNFPLRALSGIQMGAGHLPLWNPFIWSGSPLLGGLNAGSFYPLTFVFAVTGALAAWVVNLLGVYWAGGLGMYALARQYRLRPLASLLGALTFAFSGTMSGQLVHLGVIQGMAWMPLLVLAELRLSWVVLGTGPVRGVRRFAGRSPWPWIALLALMIGLEALTGEPRSMAETEIVAPAVALWLVGRGPASLGRRAAYAGSVVLAGVWGTALAAAELAPGWTFIQQSQRAVESYHFFGSGSLQPAWSVLLLVPDLFGGAGLWGQPHFFNNYNLPEVTGYVGLLPLAAAFVLLTRSFGRRRSPLSGDWGMWLALGTLGVLLAWGYYTPLGHIWAQIPLFGKTRLQSRNLEIVDLALSVLLAFWADRLLGEGAGAEGVTGWRRWVATAPVAAAALTCLVAIAAPRALEESFGATPVGAALGRTMTPWFVVQLVVCGGIGALVWGWRRLGPSGRRRALTTAVVLDVAFFLIATSTATTPPRATIEPTHAAAAAVLGSSGRFGIYDTTARNIDTATQIGQPDLNAFTRLPSVEGYGSIVGSVYGGATGTHTLNTLSHCALATGVFDPLRLATLAVLPSELAPGVGRDGRPPSPPAVCPGAPAPGTSAQRTLYLGWATTLTGATVVLTRPGPRPLVEVLGATGKARAVRESLRRTADGWAVRFARPQLAAGLVVVGPARAVSDLTVARGASGGLWAFDGVLQDALGEAGWRFSGSWHMYGLFSRLVVPPVWFATGTRSSSARQVGATDWGTATDAVVARRAVTLVWSEAYLIGWHAVLRPAGGGPARTVTALRHGLVQAVRVPPGRWTVTFVYRPPHLTLGIAGSSAAVAGFAAVAVLAFARRRRGLASPA